ncbi:vanillate O-demethylase monooxygenase subunit [Burkholderia sp. D7]|nr:vanillate O-demethylase monooxygenase subunit [Burkholderia sp. D7]
MEFLRNTWYVALWSQDLAPEQMISRKFLNEPIVLFRQADGKAAAIADSCAHRFTPLSMGKIVKGTNVRCPYHGLEYDGTGKCVFNPHSIGQIPPAMKVRSYPLAEKHSIIWIWMGEKEADPSLIPDFSVLDPDPKKPVSKRDWLLMQASYELIADNLMDLSHSAVIHDGILGSEHTVKGNVTIEQRGTTVTAGRNVPNVPAPGLYNLIYKNDGRQVDLWQDMRWDAPACMLNNTGVTEPGALREEGTGFYGLHFLTPETETTTYYLFCAVRFKPISWGQPLDGEIQTKISELRRFAFQEQDQTIIKAQQDRILGQKTLQHPVLLDIDAGPVRYRRVLEGLIKQEREATNTLQGKESQTA